MIITMIMIIIVMILLSLISNVNSYNKAEDMLLSIPFPSGILVDKIIVNNTMLRVGRLQYNTISLRPQWSSLYILESLLTHSIGSLH